jgi:hypothetical protein
MPDYRRKKHGLCSKYWLHAFLDPRLAEVAEYRLLNDCKFWYLWSATASRMIKFDLTKMGAGSLTTIEMIKRPIIPIKKRLDLWFYTLCQRFLYEVPLSIDDLAIIEKIQRLWLSCSDIKSFLRSKAYEKFKSIISSDEHIYYSFKTFFEEVNSYLLFRERVEKRFDCKTIYYQGNNVANDFNVTCDTFIPDVYMLSQYIGIHFKDSIEHSRLKTCGPDSYVFAAVRRVFSDFEEVPVVTKKDMEEESVSYIERLTRYEVLSVKEALRKRQSRQKRKEG